MESSLCGLCAEIDIHGALERLLPSPEGQENSDSVRVESPWHSTLAAVDASSSSCDLCALVMKGWQSSREAVVEQAVRDAMFDPQDPPPGLHDAVRHIAAYRDAAGVALEVVRRPRGVGDGRQNRSSLFLQVACGPTVRSSFDVLDPVVAELRIAREGGGSVPGEALDGAVSAMVSLHMDVLTQADPLSEESLDVARGWLDMCVSSHGPACKPPTGTEGWMPTRLLELVLDSGETHLQLRDSSALTSAGDTRYVALSHCWGQGGTPFTTTHDTLGQRLSGIDVESMPQTFRDAVALTARLGLRLLWIDSLCIIQDDAADWAREAARMAGVYRNAHLVLNASNSAADRAGFLGPRDLPDTVRLANPPSSPGRHHQLYLRLLPPEGRRSLAAAAAGSAGPDHLAHEPISARAWCLQERALPVRSLQYASHQTFWECERMRASEDGDAVAQTGGALERLCKTARGDSSAGTVFARHPDDRDPGREQEYAVGWFDWYRMVEDYTARSITKHADRLPALSGLAQAVAGETDGGGGGMYLAGLWKPGLLEGLVWCRSSRPETALAATPEYVAPSWSWASVSGPVQFPVYTWYAQRARWKARMADFEPLADYLGHELVPRDADAYGRLRDGVLLLRAPLMPVLSIRPRPSAAPMLYSLFGQEPGRSEVADVVVQMEAGSGTIWIEGGLDVPDPAGVDPAGLSVVLLTRLPHVLEEGFVEHRFGIIVRRSSRDARYQRVGFVDGVVLKKSSMLDAVRGRGVFSVVGYRRPYQDGDMDEAARDNDLASDPLLLRRVEVAIS